MSSGIQEICGKPLLDDIGHTTLEPMVKCKWKDNWKGRWDGESERGGVGGGNRG